MPNAGNVSWQLLDWFGVVNGIKNTSLSDAEDVTIHTGDKTPLELEFVSAGQEVEFQCEDKHVSVSWRDGSGMHADIIRLDS